jgi:hypothetical protein
MMTIKDRENGDDHSSRTPMQRHSTKFSVEYLSTTRYNPHHLLVWLQYHTTHIFFICFSIHLFCNKKYLLIQYYLVLII